MRIIDEYESDGPTGPARLALRARKLRSHLHGLLQGQQPPSLAMSNYYWDQHGSVIEYATDFLGAGRKLTAEYDLN